VKRVGVKQAVPTAELSYCVDGQEFSIERVEVAPMRARWFLFAFEEALAMQLIRFAPLVIVLVSLCPSPAAAQSDLSFEPYTVYVVEEKSHARCGPSDEYYRTDPLRRGQALEVYAETDDGWLGIRPPVESFCWVQAETIELDDTTDVGTVIEDRTVAWIGTHLGRARSYRWQVQMAKGEEVTVIGKSEREGPDGPQLWYRVVPPSGEYRWVRREQVVDSSEKLVEATQRATRQTTLGDRFVEGANDKTATASPTTDKSKRRNDRRTTPALAVGDGASVLQPAPTPAPEPVPQARSVAQNLPVNPAVTEPWQSNDNRLAVDNVSAVTPQTELAVQAAPEPEYKTASSAEVEFIGRPQLLEIGGQPTAPAQSVAASDGNWVTGTSPRVASNASLGAVAGATLANPIAQVVGQSAILPQSLTPGSAPANRPRIISADRIALIESEVQWVDVERLDLVFSRLMAAQATAAEVEPITRAARRLMNATTDPASSGRARMLAERTEQYRRVAERRDGRAVIGQSGSIQPLPSGTDPNGPADQSAITGTLVQVYSSRSNSPPFALTDNTGRTIAYVTPTPGTNLRVHLNSKVRVAGYQGFVTGLNTPHIVATNVARTVE